jgi:hypothetical protein
MNIGKAKRLFLMRHETEMERRHTREKDEQLQHAN